LVGSVDNWRRVVDDAPPPEETERDDAVLSWRRMGG
jgi:hypothetical protein